VNTVAFKPKIIIQIEYIISYNSKHLFFLFRPEFGSRIAFPEIHRRVCLWGVPSASWIVCDTMSFHEISDYILFMRWGVVYFLNKYNETCQIINFNGFRICLFLYLRVFLKKIKKFYFFLCFNFFLCFQMILMYWCQR